ncbi:MAG: FHA domain-containing protein [Anaerolineae bacterium]|jgi:pSer/pThr/pTyr-binding forkhead associated (FHA) protein
MTKRKSRPDIRITFMSGPLDGKSLAFPQPEIGEEKTLVIGRREGCDIYLPFDHQVSRVHARLICSSRPVIGVEDITDPSILMFWLEDVDSRNGTFIEREDSPVIGRVSLRPGTLFRIGRTWLRLDPPLSFF